MAFASMVLFALPATAQDATWTGTTSADWFISSNWSALTVPSGTATFTDNGAPTAVAVVGNGSIGTILLTSQAPAYSFTGVGFNGGFTGGGIVNNSSYAPSFTFNGGVTPFYNSSSAGNANITLTNGNIYFEHQSTAGTANINISSSALVQFQNSATAANSTIANNGSLAFFSTTAGNSTIFNNGSLAFYDTATAGNATITTNSGATTVFRPSYGGGPPATSTAGQARLITNGGGVVDFSGTAGPASDNKLTAGSIEGAVNLYLGANQLTVGGNNLSTTASGVISDCGSGSSCFNNFSSSTGGSLVKIGTGTLTLAGNNTYTGGTTINGGTLAVNGSIAASNLTSVNTGGTLTGTGTVGNTQINSGGIFAPGAAGMPGTSMTVSGNLVFLPSSMYLVEINPTTASFANVTGTATLNGASFHANFDLGNYTAMQYLLLSAAGGVFGTFSAFDISNLPSGLSYSLSYDANDVYLNERISATPLPSTWGMMLLGLGVLGFMGHRRKRKDSLLAAS